MERLATPKHELQPHPRWDGTCQEGIETASTTRNHPRQETNRTTKWRISGAETIVHVKQHGTVTHGLPTRWAEHRQPRSNKHTHLTRGKAKVQRSTGDPTQEARPHRQHKLPQGVPDDCWCSQTKSTVKTPIIAYHRSPAPDG